MPQFERYERFIARQLLHRNLPTRHGPHREGGSDKPLRDIRSMLKVSGDQINRTELDEWIRRRGLEAEWKEIPQ